MRRGWILFLLAAAAGAQEFSEANLDRAIEMVALGDKQWVERIAAWGPGAARAAPALVAAWSQEAQRVRPTPGFAEAVDAALAAIGPMAAPDLGKALKGKAPSERALRLLEQFAYGPPPPPTSAAGEAGLFATLNDTDPLVRLAAARGLATLGTAIVSRMLTLLGDKSPRRRQAAAFALGHVEPPPEAASGTLIGATRDPDESVRAAAVFAVGRLRSAPQETFGVLCRAAEDPSARVVQAVVDAFEARGKEAAPQLLETWEKSDPAASAGTEALARFGDAVLEQVVEVMKPEGARRRRFGAVYLGLIGAEQDLSVIDRTLAPLLSDPAPEVRVAAAEAFGIALPTIAGRALDAILAATADADPRVRMNALAAAARGAPGDARVRAAVDRAATDTTPAVSKTAAFLRDTSSPAAVGAALGSDALPLAARMLAAERPRSFAGGFGPVIPSLANVVKDADLAEALRAAAATTLRQLQARRIFEARGAGGDAAARAAANRGLRWLAAAQAKDGRWAADAWNAHDLGVTGLAVLAFLAAGHTDRGPGPYADHVRDALKFIVSSQKKGGLLAHGPEKQHTLVEHAIATQALCEAVGMTDDLERRPIAQAAVACCVTARNPNLGWRYLPRAGENDTHVTVWMAGTLRIAEATGFEVEPAAFEGARQWLDTITDPNFGVVGYNYRGGMPFRAKDLNDDFPTDLTRAPTAAGIWCRMILGENAATSYLVKRGAEVCLEVPPAFRPGQADFYYWYYGTLALFEVGGTHWTKWDARLKEAVLPRQKADGSWDPEDAWGFAGGRVYATSILTLALLTPSRYPRGWGVDGPLPEPYAQAAQALRSVAGSGPPRPKAAALGTRPR